MTNSVSAAMIESYLLMFFLMTAFFVYFCGMVWAFCNPKLSGIEDDAPESETHYLTFDDIPLEHLNSPEHLQRTRDWILETSKCSIGCDNPGVIDDDDDYVGHPLPYHLNDGHILPFEK